MNERRPMSENTDKLDEAIEEKNKQACMKEIEKALKKYGMDIRAFAVIPAKEIILLPKEK